MEILENFYKDEDFKESSRMKNGVITLWGTEVQLWELNILLVWKRNKQLVMKF